MLSILFSSLSCLNLFCRISHKIRSENVKVVCRFLAGVLTSVWKVLCCKDHRFSFSIVLESTSLRRHPHLTKHARPSPPTEQSPLFSIRIGHSLSIVLCNNKHIRPQNQLLKESWDCLTACCIVTMEWVESLTGVLICFGVWMDSCF